MTQFAPTLLKAGVATYAPRYFDKTGTRQATTEMILDGRHFPAWLAAVRDAVSYVASRPRVDPSRIGVLGISLGGFLAVALAIEDQRIRAVVELSGGVAPGWESRLSSNMPPTLILHGSEDSVVPVSEAYKLEKLLKDRRVDHEIEIFPREAHWLSPSAQLQLLMRSAEFLGRHLEVSADLATL